MMIHIGERLRALMKKYSLSQVELAEKITKQQSYINRLLTYSSIKSDVLALIIHHTPITAEELFAGDLDAVYKERKRIKALEKEVARLAIELRECKEGKNDKKAHERSD